MLSQRIAMLSFAYVRANQEETSAVLKENLQKNIAEMSLGQKYLFSVNNESTGLSKKARNLIVGSDKQISIQSKVAELISNAKALIDSPTKELDLANKNLAIIASTSTDLLRKFSKLSETLKEDSIKGIKLIKIINNSFSGLMIILVIGIWYFIFKTLTKRLKLEFSKRSRYEKKLVNSNYELEQFASIAAHDIRAPLHNIRAFAELLSDVNIK